MRLLDYQPHLDFITSQKAHMTQLVYDWTRINSGSYNLDGLATMCRVLEDNFLWLHGDAEVLDLPPLQAVGKDGALTEKPLGKALRIRKRPDAPLRVFLGGHMDTVFGVDSPFQHAHFIDENTLNAPGAADLKGGLVVMLKALEALERSEWAENIGWEVLINPDEEIGSVGSRGLLEEAAKRNHLGLIYEPSLPDGALVSERKGSGNFTLVVHGVAAHAGREFDKGRNAIVLLADVIQRMYALNGRWEGFTLNVGRIEGGGAVNVVPDLAMVHFNVRITASEHMEQVSTALQEIVRFANIQEGFSAELHGGFTRPPKLLNEHAYKLQALVGESMQMLGQKVAWQASGGCCDGNNLAYYGLPNIDTLGVRGGNIHSDKEYMLVDSLVERAQLSALLLMRLAKGDVLWHNKN
jgi:glutamate carboxypeptidase